MFDPDDEPRIEVLLKEYRDEIVASVLMSVPEIPIPERIEVVFGPAALAWEEILRARFDALDMKVRTLRKANQELTRALNASFLPEAER